MTYSVAVPINGVAGYRFLVATEANQRTALEESAQISREVQYFKDNISNVTSAEDLVNDRTLLKVALGAFGLGEEIDKKAFVRAILDGGTDDPQSLANRLVDPRYEEFSARFGFGNALGSRVGEADFATRITTQYVDQEFEVSVGQSDTNLRLALEFSRTISSYVNPTGTVTGDWLSIVGNTAMRTVFETAYGLPSQFGALDIDRQVEVLSERTREIFGSGEVSVFENAETADQMISRFLAIAEAQAGPTALTPGFAALSLLGGSVSSSDATVNLLLSNT